MRQKLLIGLLFIAYANAFTLNSDMQIYIDTLKIEAKKENPNFSDFDKTNGEKIFTTKMYNQKANSDISCVSCHFDMKSEGKNIFTSKPISPLAPSANKDRLTNVKDVKKWLRRNFNDVYAKEGSAQQKGDVLYYIMSK